MVTSSDSGIFSDSQIIHIHQQDSFRGLDLQSSVGDTELSQVDYVQGLDYGSPSIVVNPMAQIGFINLNIYPFYDISLNIVTHV